MTAAEDPAPRQQPLPPPPSPDAPWSGAAPPPPPPPGYGTTGPSAPGYGASGYGTPGYGASGYGTPGYGPGYGTSGYGVPMPAVPPGDRYARPLGPPGRIRPTGMTMLLFFVTLGIWGFVYYFQTHEEMKRHTGEGVGGVIALVIALVFGIINPYLLSHEVGQLYERSGRQPPVTALTGLWFFPGALILVGPFVWFVQTNRALNEYWEGLGVR